MFSYCYANSYAAMPQNFSRLPKYRPMLQILICAYLKHSHNIVESTPPSPELMNYPNSRAEIHRMHFREFSCSDVMPFLFL